MPELPLDANVGAPPKKAFGAQAVSTNERSTPFYVQQEIVGRVLGATCVVEWHDGPLSENYLTSLRSQHPLRRVYLDTLCSSGLPSFPGCSGLPAANLLGVTESWQSQDWPGPSEFIYRGSWGPIQLTAAQQAQIIQAAEFVAMQTGIAGWIQFDLIEDPTNQLWLIEVNPRWTAGMEVLTRSGLVNPALSHARSWNWRAAPKGQGKSMSTLNKTGKHMNSIEDIFPTRIFDQVVGKAVVYCPQDLPVTARLVDQLGLLPRENYADIPSVRNVGMVFRKGQPLLTVFAETKAEVDPCKNRQQLLHQLHRLIERLPVA